MEIKKVFIFSVFLLACTAAIAGPARFREVPLSQPDGYTFTATFYGDEFYRIIRTKDDGYAIAKDADGWWCYAYYEVDGTKRSSGARVGTPASPEILDASRQIPYSTLAQNANRMRFKDEKDDEPIIKRIMSRNAAMTKGSLNIPAEKHGIVILAQYKDVKFQYTRQDFENLLNSESSSGSTGCAVDYFNDQFQGKVNFTFDVSEIVTLPRNRADYGGNMGDDGSVDDKMPGQMIYDACEEADSHIDFSRYDDDNDGFVDNVFVFFAGEDESDGADEDCIWAHAWYLSSSEYYGRGGKIYNTADGVKVNRYACSAELKRSYTTSTKFDIQFAGIGTFCHEYSHTLGLPDLYDTDYEQNGQAAALWASTALMDGGNHNNDGKTPPNYNCIERELIGLTEPEAAEGGDYTLEPVNINGRYLKIPTETEGEYFLIECRSINEKWDQHIGGSGLLVYHIDKTESVLAKWESNNNPNADAFHQCADLVEADGRKDAFENQNDFYFASYTPISTIFFPAGSSSLSSTTHSAFMAWNGSPMPFSLENITANGDGSVSFRLNSGVAIIPEARNVVSAAFTDAAIIEWESTFELGTSAYFTWNESGSGETMTMEVPPYEGNKHSVTIEGLKPRTTYRFGIVYRASGDESEETGEVIEGTFTTQRSPAVSYPYIYITDNATYLSGSRLPLRVINAQDAASVSWELDDKEITVSGDGWYHPASGRHTLKATVNYPGGGKDIITRQITVQQ